MKITKVRLFTIKWFGPHSALGIRTQVAFYKDDGDLSVTGTVLLTPQEEAEIQAVFDNISARLTEKYTGEEWKEEAEEAE